MRGRFRGVVCGCMHDLEAHGFLEQRRFLLDLSTSLLPRRLTSALRTQPLLSRLFLAFSFCRELSCRFFGPHGLCTAYRICDVHVSSGYTASKNDSPSSPHAVPSHSPGFLRFLKCGFRVDTSAYKRWPIPSAPSAAFGVPWPVCGFLFAILFGVSPMPPKIVCATFLTLASALPLSSLNSTWFLLVRVADFNFCYNRLALLSVLLKKGR